jgi:hypothetical protein
MTPTTSPELIETGDVVEFELDGELVTALVLLTNGEAIILDLNDGSTPIVARFEEIQGLRRFEPDLADLLAA